MLQPPFAKCRRSAAFFAVMVACASTAWSGPPCDVNCDRAQDVPPDLPVPEIMPPADQAPEIDTGQISGSFGAASSPQSAAPNVIGDFAFSGGQIVYFNGSIHTIVNDFPPAGGARRMKVSENNGAIPRDRVFFMYNHFHNALDQDATDWAFPEPPTSRSIDRYTLGLEKTFFGGLASLEVRVPLVGGLTQEVQFFRVSGGDMGNVTLIPKVLLWQSPTVAVALGMGIDLPTGSDVNGFTDGFFSFEVQNEAVHLQPFIGFLATPNYVVFVQMFTQFDFDTNGNVVVTDFSASPGRLNDQHLWFVDVSAGFWAYRNPRAPVVTGIAPMLELHYTKTVNDADNVVHQSALTGGTFTFGNTAGHVDVLNLTAGVHIAIGELSSLRFSAVSPLKDRGFDAEVGVQFNRRF